MDTVLRYRLAVLLISTGVTVVAGFFAQRLTFDSDMEIWFLENDENLITYRDFLEQFHADEIEVIGVLADDVFVPELLQAVDRVTKQAEKAPYVHRVHSLTNTKIVQSQGTFHVSIDRLADEVPRTVGAARDLRRRAMDSALIRGNLVSENGRATAIVVEVDPLANTVEAKSRMVHALHEIAARHFPKNVEWHLAGSPSFDEAFFRYTERDFLLLAPVAILVVLLSCLTLLRRTKAALTPLAVVVCATIWTFGLMGALGLKINIISTALIALILAVGVADSIHVVSEYYQELMAGRPHEEAVAVSTANLITPCFFTSATTVVGFLSLLTSELKPIFEFGWLAALGVTFAFLLSLTLLPAALRMLSPPNPAVIRREREGLTARVLLRLGRPTRRSSALVLIGSAALVALAVWSLPRLKVGANPLNYFRRDDPIRVATYRVDEALGGTASFELLVDTQPGGLKDPKVLARLQNLETRLEGVPAISNILSILDSLREVRRVLTDGRPESAILPDTRPMAAQFYLMLEGDEDFRKNVLGDYQTTRLSARVKITDAEKLISRIDELTAELQKSYYDDELRVQPTGHVKLMNDMEHYLLNGQIRSLLTAFCVITVMMGLLLRSVRLAFFSMIPNFVPIALGLAFMSLSDIALDPGTVMIGSMAIGLVVDDTVHFLVRLRQNLKASDVSEAISRSMEQTGRPIIFTSLILAAGCATTMVGSFSPTIYFGLVSATVVVLALIADLVMLPAALIIVAPRFGNREENPSSSETTRR